MPEGNHFGQRRLRTLKKGIARIAFQAEDACNNELKIHIIPVGLNYSNYVNLRSKLLVRFGEPIDISKHLELYRQNPALAYNALIEDLEVGMKREMIQIDDEACYEEYENLREIFTPAYLKEKHLPKHQNSSFEIDKKMIAAVDKLKIENPSQFQILMDDVKTYSGLVKENGLTLKSIQTTNIKLYGLLIKLPLLLITLPLFIWGFINNIIPVGGAYLLSKKIKDVQFISSIRFVVGMFLFPIAYIIQVVLFWIISGNGLYALYYLVSLAIGAVIAYNWRRYFLDLVMDFKLFKVRMINPVLVSKLKEINSSIYSRVKGLV